MDTAELTALLRNRDQSGLKYLYEQYSSALLGVILRIVRNKEDAENVLQETFLKIWQNIDQYDADRAILFTWMSRIARNAALDSRKAKNYNFIKQTEELNNQIHPREIPATDAAFIDVNHLTKDLDSKYKQVLELVYILGYTHMETAEILGIPGGTVKTRLRQAFNLIREVLKDEKTLFLSGLTILILIVLALWN